MLRESLSICQNNLSPNISTSFSCKPCVTAYLLRHMTSNTQNHFPRTFSVASNSIFVVLIVLFLSKRNFLLYVRLWLVESLVIVPFSVITSMCNVVIIISYFCMKKILFSKKEKRQKNVFFMIFRKKLGNT